jgi:hypothetical protein
VVEALRAMRPKPDLFTFAQSPEDPQPRFDLPFEGDNAAAIPITTYEEWLQNRATAGARRDVRKAAKRGVVVREVEFNDDLVRGICTIYNETRLRQGREFWHFGKPFETVKSETSHALGRSWWLGAYYDGELIGFIKLLRQASTADIVLILCKEAHRDKCPTNALIGAAVALCAREGMKFLTYAQYYYLKNETSTLQDFKKRNGFEPVVFPRYYLPITLKGRLAFGLKFHHGIKGLLPESLVSIARGARASALSRLRAARGKSGPIPS